MVTEAAIEGQRDMKFGTFWAGNRLPGLEFCCLRSFTLLSHDVTLFSFDKIENLPEGVHLCDAGEIVNKDTVNKFLIQGKPSLSHFSDYFRYKMFLATRLAWVDTDMFALASFDIPDDTNIFALESEKSICGGILRVIQTEPALPELVRRTEFLMDKNMRWGGTGPLLLTGVLGNEVIRSATHPPEEFFPIHFSLFWKAFLPEYYDECSNLCRSAKTIHLWNNIIDRLGFWKDMLPPKGSFLHALFMKETSDTPFVATYPDNVVRQMIENWRMRGNGKDLGIKTLASQIVPSIGRTVRHYVG
jgi:hypothetical protein